MLWGLLGCLKAKRRSGLADGTAMSSSFLCPNGTTTLSLTIPLPLLHPSCGWLTTKTGLSRSADWSIRHSLDQWGPGFRPKTRPGGTAGTEKGVIWHCWRGGMTSAGMGSVRRCAHGFWAFAWPSTRETSFA